MNATERLQAMLAKPDGKLEELFDASMSAAGIPETSQERTEGLISFIEELARDVQAGTVKSELDVRESFYTFCAAYAGLEV